jgi:hypothetical protein
MVWMLAYNILVTADVYDRVALLKLQHPYCPQATMGLDNVDYLRVNFYILMHSNDVISLLCRFPLKAVKVMHTVALRTEATISGGEMPPNLGQAFKVI